MVNISCGKARICVKICRNGGEKAERSTANFAVNLVTRNRRPAVVRRRPCQSSNCSGTVEAACYERCVGYSGFSWIKSSKHTFTAALSGDRCFCGVIIRSSINAARGDAAVIITDHDPSFLVDSCIKEIEQIAAGSTAADSAALDRIARRDVLSAPRHAAIKRCCHIEIPHAGEVSRGACLSVSAMKVSPTSFAAEEGERCAAGITSYHLGKYSVEDGAAINNCSTYVCVFAPSYSLVCGYGNMRVAVICLIAEIQRAVGRNSDRRVALGLVAAICRGAALAITGRRAHRKYRPRDAIVVRPDNGLLAGFVERQGPAASFIGNVNCAVRRNLDVAMQSGACGNGEHW